MPIALLPDLAITNAGSRTDIAAQQEHEKYFAALQVDVSSNQHPERAPGCVLRKKQYVKGVTVAVPLSGRLSSLALY
jgi:hypothetical protein